MPRRRGTELALLVFAVLLVIAADSVVDATFNDTISTDVLAYGAGFALIYAVAHVAVRWLAPYADPVMLPMVALLNGLGLVLIRRLDLAEAADARQDGSPVPAGDASVQVVWTGVGLALFVAVLLVVRDHRALARYTYTLAAAGLVFLALPALLPGRFSEVNGARIWIRVAGFSIQPGEFAKLALMVFFAAYLVQKRDVLSMASRRVAGIDLPRGRDLGPVLVAWGRPCGAGLREGPGHLAAVLRDLRGDALRRHRADLLAADRRRPVHGRRRDRVPALRARAGPGDVWLRPFDFRDDEGYQLVQGLFGMGTGGLLGTGLGGGRPEIVPFAKTDFIVAAIGEELGLDRPDGAAGRVRDGGRARPADRAGRARLVRQAARRRSGVHAGPAGVHRRRRRHQADPADRADHAVPVLRRLVAGGQLGAGRPAAADQRRGPPAAAAAGAEPPLADAKTQVVRVNAPLRRVAVAMLVLFGLLIANANYLQVVQGSRAARRPGQHPGAAGRVRAGARPDRRRRAGGRRVGADRRRLKYLRRYPERATYAPVDRLLLADLRRHRHRAGGERLPLRQRRPAVRPAAVRPADRRGPAGRQRRAHARPARPEGGRARRSATGAGAVVALDPRTGAILAMVSSPSFDPNPISSHDPARIRAEYNRLADDPTDPLLNRAITQRYPPGSTFKVVTAAAALESGPHAGHPDRLPAPLPAAAVDQGAAQLRRRAVQRRQGDARRRAEELVQHRVREARPRRSASRAARRPREFGFNGEALRGPDAGRRASRSARTRTTPPLAQSAIGQFDVALTPLQMAMVAAAVANRGVLMTPYLVREVRAPDLTVLDRTEPEELSTAVVAGGRRRS